MAKGNNMKIKQWLITVVVLAGVGYGLFAYKSSLQQAKAAEGANMPEMAATVDAVEVAMVKYQKTIKISGEVQAYQHLSLSNEYAGTIAKLNASSGQVVEKNTVLLEINHDEEDARLIAAKARLTLNKQTHNRYLELQKNREISEELVDQAQASVEIAKSEIAVLRSMIAKKKLVAPFKAIVGLHTLEKGQYLDKNSSVLELVGVSDFTWVDFYLPQIYQELSVGTFVGVRLTDKEQPIKAKIIAVDPQLSKSSRNLKYRAQINSSTLALKPNTLLRVVVPIAEETSLIAIPDLAITRNPLGDFVFVLTPEGEGAYRAKQVKVVLGERKKDQIMILSGLAEGQLIATKGAFKLFPQMKVYIANNASEIVSH
jgi:membrane fusion protein (multidrug efflux system)